MGGEKQNEAFFVFPSDVIASQHNFAFNGWEKDFTHPQSETKWNDVFIWPNSQENPGISIDAGVAFLPENVQVDPNTGSKYTSETKNVDGVDKKVMVEDTELKNKFNEWAKGLNDESEVIKFAQAYYNERSYDRQISMGETFDRMCTEEMTKLGFDYDSVKMILPALTQSIMFWNKDISKGKFQEIIDGSSAKYKKAENTVPAKEYWEDYFSKNPGLKPKHIIYYDGDPTNAVYKFQQENGIGQADTSKVDGQLLGFDDHYVTDMTNDPRANVGHQELVDLGKKIITDHYRNKV